MFRKLVSLFAIGSAAVAQQSPPDVKPDPSKVLPYIVPAGYFDQPRDKTRSVTWPLGNGLVVALVYDLQGVVRNVLPEELPTLGLTEEQARKQAIDNLESLAQSGAIGQQCFTGPDGKPFVLFGGHWAAATCLLLPGLRQMGLKNIGSEKLCVCIPHREALLMFSKGDREYRDTMLKIIRERESDARKPLTFALFELTPNGIQELKE